MNDTCILALDRVTKRYGRNVALNEASFALDRGSIIALLGPNGAGKTTTFKCILGVTRFDGRISVAGQAVKRAGKAVRNLIGYLPQTAAFLGDDTCSNALRFLADLRGIPESRVDELLERVRLTDQRDVPGDQLSGGMRQRLALAAALLSDPPLLLLDEPTANLDAESRLEFNELLVQLRGEEKTIVLSTHFVEHVAPLADRVILLKNGEVVLDKPACALLAGISRDVVVHLNGTPSEVLVRALNDAGISDEHVSAGSPNLEWAIQRELDAEGEQRQ